MRIILGSGLVFMRHPLGLNSAASLATIVHCMDHPVITVLFHGLSCGGSEAHIGGSTHTYLDLTSAALLNSIWQLSFLRAQLGQCLPGSKIALFMSLQLCCSAMQFLSRLMSERPRMEVDPYTGNTHHITPVTLANRIMATREDLIQDVSKLIGPQVHKDNVLILRTHLEAHTYVSGTNEEKKPNYRGYRKEGKHQQSQYQL